MSDQHITAGEAQVIAQAAVQGTPMVEIPVIGRDGQARPTPFCGSCGRMVHHPNCPVGREVSA